MADRGLSSPTCFATIGVATITSTAFSTPVPIDSAITSELAPSAAPVTGPTMYVTAPAPIVVIDTASEYPKLHATAAPTTNGNTIPTTIDTAPTTPALRASATSTSNAVATMAKSRSIAPPMMPMPANSGRSTIPFVPPVIAPPTHARISPITMAMAEPWIRPMVRCFDRK